MAYFIRRHLQLCCLVVVSTILLFSTGCNKKHSDPTHTLKLRLGAEPNLLNPILTTDTYSSQVVGVIFNGLFRVNESLELEPDLAESYSISKDGKVYIFKLKHGVKWHDGTELTADDVVFTFEKMIDPKTNTVRRSNYVIEGKPIRFVAVDKYTVKAVLPKPFSPFLSSAATEILPKHLLKDVDINTATFNRHPIGTGPFKFQEWKPGQHIIVTQNPDYFRGKPKLSAIIFRSIPDANSARIALMKGDIDELDVSPQDLSQVKKIKSARLYEYDQLMYSFIGFNLKHPALMDIRVRQAIAHAVDRDSIVNAVLKGHGTVAHVPMSPVSWAYPSANQVPRHAYDPQKSIELLKKAGYAKNSQGIFEKNGKPLIFNLIYGQGGKASPKNAEIVQFALQKVGIKINILPMEWQSFLRIVNSGKHPKQFDMCMLSWSLSVDPDDYSIWHSSQYPKGFNFIGYYNKKVDRLLVQGRVESDRSKRAKIYGEVASIIGTQVPYLFLYYPTTISAVNTRVHGLADPGPAGLFIRMELISVD